MARPILAIFDRNYDFTASLQHAWHYEPLVHDVLHMKLNRVDVKPDKNAVGADAKTKSYALDDSDDFWKKYKDAQFPKVAESVEVELAEYKRAIAEVNAVSISSGDDADDRTGESTAKLTKAVESLPKLQEHKKLIDKHTNIATALLKEIKQRGLDEYFSIEEDFCNGKGDWKAALSLLSATGRGSTSDKIRLALIILLTSQLNANSSSGKGIDDEAIEGALRASGCEVGAYNYVKKMLSLNQSLQTQKGGGGNNNSSSRSNADILDWADRLYGQSVDLITKTAKHLLSGERQLPIAAAVEALLANQPTDDQVCDTFAYFDCKASSSQRTQQPPRQDGFADSGGYASAIAFVLGGGCYTEVLALRELAQRERANGRAKSVLYGATDMSGGDDFVQELGEIGNVATK